MKLKLGFTIPAGLAAMVLMVGVVFAESIPLDPAGAAGDLTVIEEVAPLGDPLAYVSGGDGLIGTAGSYPTLPDTPANRATAVNNYDHMWLQFDPPIIWSSATPLDQVFAIPGIDHGPLPGEALEFLIWGSNDQTNWEQGKIVAIYRDGFDTADTALGHSDDYTSLWEFSSSYTYFRATSGDLVEGFSSGGEGEIDGLAGPANEPPVCDSAAPSQDTIWPANHEFVAINVQGITDADDDPISVTIDSIWQDEPVDTYGDGSFTPDGQGVGMDTAEVRAERAGTPKVPGNGRVYHISFTADDGQGGSCSGEVLVSVPHDQGQGGAAVDDGALYDSTVP